MRHRLRTTKLNLQSLENRLTPAVTLNFNAGNLGIVNDDVDATIFIFQKAASVDVYVADTYVANAGGQALNFEAAQFFRGNFSVTGDINVRGGNGKNSVVLTIDDGQFVAGNFVVKLGSNSDDVQIQTRNNTQATIEGQVHIRAGDGANNIFMFDTNVADKTTVTGLKGGSRVQGADTVFGNVFQVSNCTFDQDVVITNCATIIDRFYGPNIITGNLKVIDTFESAPGNYKNLDGLVFPLGSSAATPGTYTGFLLIDGQSGAGNINQITGDVIFAGSKNRDGIYLNGQITGKVKVAGEGNDDDISIGDSRMNYSAALFDSFKYIGGAGRDRVQMFDNSSIDGPAEFRMGDGNNNYDFDHNLTFSDSLTIIAGSGIDNIGTVKGIVGGDVTIDLGDGDSFIELEFDGQNVTYRGGSGTDSIQLTGNFVAFNGLFFGGNDTAALANTTTIDDTFTADMGPGTDTYDKNGADDSQWTVNVTNAEQFLP